MSYDARKLQEIGEAYSTNKQLRVAAAYADTEPRFRHQVDEWFGLPRNTAARMYALEQQSRNLTLTS